MIKNRLICFVLCCFLLLTSCGAPDAPDSLPEASGPKDATPSDLPTGEILYPSESAQQLTTVQEELLLDYMDRCFASLADFSVRGADDLFTADAATEATGNEAVWAYLIGVRQLSQTDLRLTDYHYTLTVIDIEAENDELQIKALEDSTQNFAAFPDIDSESYGTYHLFSMRQAEDGWKLTAHSQWDYLYSTIMDKSREFYEQPGDFPDIDYSGRVQSLLAEATAYHAQREAGEAAEVPAAAHAYDRKAAVAYAHLWAQERNAEWPDYTRNGGNCQNYASQCLLAGGIPMDPYGSAVWKWYGSTPDNMAGALGRSASWSAVKQFVAYVQNNEGYGLAAQGNAPYFSGEPGDLIVMGNTDDWRHVVIITDIVRDGQGQTVDYLVDSNTGGLKNFPVSAHPYSCQMLVHILGWND